MQRISLGTYGIDEGREIQRKFNEKRNKFPERHPQRLKAHILLRGRGRRANIYKKSEINIMGKKQTRFVPIADGQSLPLEHAQRVAVYLIINNEGKK